MQLFALIITTILPGRQLERCNWISPAGGSIEAVCQREARRLGLEEMDVYLWDQTVPTGLPMGTKDSGVLVLSSGLVELLDDEALRAAILHELAHVRLGHSRTLTRLLGVIVGVIAAIGLHRQSSRRRRVLTQAMISGVGTLAILAVMRRMELEADAATIAYTRDAESLARALLIVRSGDPTASVSEYEPSPRSPLAGLLTIYPSPERRFPELFGESR